MKTKAQLLALCLMLSVFSFATAQTSKDKLLEFKVTGNCAMCKKTIESSLKGKEGIKEAVWNKDSKNMKVVFDPSIVSEEQVHQAIADSGYDTDKKKASDKAYTSLHGCCQYKRTLHKK
jgi:mercuric ion binding protein